jgi:hypothetical protein
MIPVMDRDKSSHRLFETYAFWCAVRLKGAQPGAGIQIVSAEATNETKY